MLGNRFPIDVYKRQVYGRVYADGNIMEGYPAITEDNWAGGIQIETQPNTEGYTAVSYTHLDVYKRQVNQELPKSIIQVNWDVMMQWDILKH